MTRTTPSPHAYDAAVIHRGELPIDDQPHGIDLTGDILHAAVRRAGAVDVWYQRRPAAIQHMRRSFQIVGTGQPVPAHFGGLLLGHKGTALTPEGQLVWHVLENYCPHQNLVDTAEMGDKDGYGSAICADCHLTLKGDGEGGWIPV